MIENHKKEQYFFDQSTIDLLADLVSRFNNPCCLCCPSLGVELEKRRVKATILDCDDRFSHVRGFIKYDLYKPIKLMNFDFIICDPPFNIVSLSQLFNAIKVLSQPEQKMWISHLTARKYDVIGTFAKFGLKETGFYPQYQIPQHPTNIQFYGNV